MASAFGHAFAAFTASRFFPKFLMQKRVIFLGIASSIMPDIDVLAFKYGIPYEDLWGHRGMTHSIFFAVIWSILLLLLFHTSEKSSNKYKLFTFYFLATASHSILDALTTGGTGVAFFAPFDLDRYFLPWRVIKVSPISASRFFSEWGLKVLASEAIYIGIPCLALYGMAKLNTLRKSK